jgi:hypothetical protein
VISDFLLTGKGNAISMTDLAHVCQVPERALQREVLEARLNGELIISDEAGYYLPEDESDIRQYVTTRKAYIKTASKALKPFIKALRGR